MPSSLKIIKAALEFCRSFFLLGLPVTYPLDVHNQQQLLNHALKLRPVLESQNTFRLETSVGANLLASFRSIKEGDRTITLEKPLLRIHPKKLRQIQRLKRDEVNYMGGMMPMSL